MARYGRDIVATRRLSKKNKARLGRFGDTEIRKIDGEDNHVNALEAYLIDVKGKAGEEYAKEVGAGTRNPITGLLERHGNHYTDNKEHIHDSSDDSKYYYVYTDSEGVTNRDYTLPPGNAVHDINPHEGELSYEELTGIIEGPAGGAKLAAYVSEEFGVDYNKDLVEGLQNNDIVYYDKHAGHGITWKDKLYHVIKSPDVVLVE